MADFRMGGRFHWLAEYNGRILNRGVVPNGIVTATINDLWEVYFRAGTQKEDWYFGLIASSGFSTLSASDTMASHSGWTEATNYSGSRPEWVTGAAAGGVIANPAAAQFTMSAADGLAGMFVVSDNTKGGASGTLWASGQFPTTQSIPVGGVFKLFYELEGREG